MSIPKILKIEDIESMSTDFLILAYKNGYKIEKMSPHIVDTLNTETIENQDKSISTLKISTLTEWKPLSQKEIKDIKNMVSL